MGRTPDQVTHLSHSSIATFMRCPRQWAYSYLEGLRRPPGVALIKGSALDKAATFNLDQKRVTKRDLHKDDVLEVAEDAFRKDVDNNGGQSEIDWEGTNFARALDSAIGLTDIHMTYHAPLIQPREVQLEVHRLITPKGRDFVGFIDFVEEDGTLGDVKSGSRRMPAGDADTDQQASAYAWLVGEPIAFRYWRAIDTGSKKTHEVVETGRDQVAIDWFAGKAADVSAAIDAGVFPPNDQGWWCDKRWCGFYRMCHEGRKPQIG